MTQIRKPLDRKFRKLSLKQRLEALYAAGYLSTEDLQNWQNEEQLLSCSDADRMIENVIGRFALPEGLAVNFLVNSNRYQIPLVVEEPSVVAALSFAALLSEKTGGFTASAERPVLTGQVQLVGISDTAAAQRQLTDQHQTIIDAANACIPNMLQRGGGALSVSSKLFRGTQSGAEMLVVHIDIDTCDAMGANQVNTVCEAIAPMLEAITGGTAVLKILSNLADQALVKAQVTYPTQLLATKDWSGEEVRDRIVLASDFALADVYRATTHNKGIMNGIDAVAIATGNDWRAIEAAAHAFAARSGQYRALSCWSVSTDGDLYGSIELPLKVGTVGGSLQTNPAVRANLSLLGISSAPELAGVMAAVGLAQNFAALRALASSGIQQGHMTLHARSVALAAQAPDHLFDEVVRRLVQDGEIKIHRAQAIIEELQNNTP